MKHKKLLVILCALLFCVISLTTISAAAYAYLIDEADVLSASEESKLIDHLTEIRDEYDVRVSVVTIETLSGAEIETYATDYYDQNFSRSDDGIMLLVAIEERKYYIVTHNFGSVAVSDAEIYDFQDALVRHLSKDHYFDAFTEYASFCKKEISAETSEPIAPLILFSCILGAGFSFMVVSIMRRKLKSVTQQNLSRTHIRKDSLIMTRQQDRFLYKNVIRTPRDNDGNVKGAAAGSVIGSMLGGNSNSGRGGGSRGGGGGSF